MPPPQWTKWCEYGKHKSPPSWSRDETIAATADGGDSRYFADVDIEGVETRAARSGVYWESRKPATVHKVCEFDHFVGASEGRPSRWVHVESTNGLYHGRPITEEVYLSRMRKRIESP